MVDSSTVFGFPEISLKPIVAELAGEPVRSFRMEWRHEKRGPNGICGEYLIPTFVYTTNSNRTGEADVFVRRPNKKRLGTDQACHYAYLQGAGVPVPKVYGALKDEEGREVLFLEHLREVTTSDEEFWRNRHHFESLLSLLARFNAVAPSPEYIGRIGRAMAYRGVSTIECWNLWLPFSVHMLHKVWKHAVDGSVGSKLKNFCSQGTERLDKLQILAFRLLRPVNSLESGLTHGDLHPGNVGWRGTNDDLVLFDFEDIMIATKLYDAAMCLGAPEDFGAYPCPRRDLAQYYLEQSRMAGGSPLSIDRFLEDLLMIWFARKINLWELLPPDLDGPPYESIDPGQTREGRCEKLFRLLGTLCRQIPTIGEILAQPARPSA